MKFWESFFRKDLIYLFFRYRLELNRGKSEEDSKKTTVKSHQIPVADVGDLVVTEFSLLAVIGSINLGASVSSQISDPTREVLVDQDTGLNRRPQTDHISKFFDFDENVGIYLRHQYILEKPKRLKMSNSEFPLRLARAALIFGTWIGRPNRNKWMKFIPKFNWFPLGLL